MAETGAAIEIRDRNYEARDFSRANRNFQKSPFINSLLGASGMAPPSLVSIIAGAASIILAGDNTFGLLSTEKPKELI